jgi:hypothetical protein
MNQPIRQSDLGHHDIQLLDHTEAGDSQCDQHLRSRNERLALEHIETRNSLVMHFLPFIWLQDQNLEPVALMETVAERLMMAADEERQRRKALIAAE